MKLLYPVQKSLVQLSRIPWLRKGLLLLYRIQLFWVVRVFKNLPDVQAIILRRPEVLNDGMPGESDLDLTIVFSTQTRKIQEVVASLAKAHQKARKFAPVLGETKFVDEIDLHTHFGAFEHDYGENNIHFLYMKDSDLLTSKTRESPFKRIGILRRFSYLLFFQAWDVVLNHRRKPSPRNIDRTLKKLEICAELLNPSPPESEIVKFNSTEPDLLRGANFFLEKVVKALDSVPVNDPVPIQVQGNVQRLSKEFLDRVDNLSKALLYSIEESDRVIFTPFRQYRFSWRLLLLFNSPLTRKRESQIIPILREFSGPLSGMEADFDPTYPIPLDPKRWGFFLQSDSIQSLILRRHHYEVTKNELIERQHLRFNASVSTLLHGLIEAMFLVPTVARTKDTNYLLDLVFGQLIFYRQLLQKGIFYSSIDALDKGYLHDLGLSKSQRDLLSLYKTANQSEVDRLDLVEVWNLFGDLIAHEFNEARKFTELSLKEAVASSTKIFTPVDAQRLKTHSSASRSSGKSDIIYPHP